MIWNMATTSTRKKRNVPELRFRVLEEAREAVTKLRTLRTLLSPQDTETLAILMDRDLMDHLDKSTREATVGKIEPLARILK